MAVPPRDSEGAAGRGTLVPASLDVFRAEPTRKTEAFLLGDPSDATPWAGKFESASAEND